MGGASGASLLVEVAATAGIYTAVKKGVVKLAETGLRSLLTKGGLKKLEGMMAKRAVGGASRARIPWKFGNTGGNLGVTDRFGNITIRPGLRGKQLRETLRHESVHRFFSPRDTGSVNRFRAWLGEQAYGRSHLVRYIEEALAEGIATRSLRRAFIFPVKGYVSPTRTLLEAGAYGVGTSKAAEKAKELLNDD